MHVATRYVFSDSHQYYDETSGVASNNNQIIEISDEEIIGTKKDFTRKLLLPFNFVDSLLLGEIWWTSSRKKIDMKNSIITRGMVRDYNSVKSTNC